MRPRSKKAFILASGVHLAFAALLLFFAIWNPTEENKEPVSFELFSPPAENVVPAQPEPEVLPTVSFDFTEPEPPPPVQIPDPPKPKPKPEPTPVVPKPTPKPTPMPAPKPEPPKPVPAPEPTPAPKPEPKPIDFEEFRRKNPLDEPKETPAPTPDPIVAPRINTSAITQNLESMLSREDVAQVKQQSSTDQAALNRYFQKIKAAVRGAWAKPHGLHDSLRVTVSFRVSGDGRISGARVSSSSGNEIFDQSVLQAFSRAGTVGPSPDRQAYPLRLEFRMTD